MNKDDLVFMLEEILCEACQGPAKAEFTWFNSNEADSGMLAVLEKIDAATASREPTPGARTIAAHAAHAAFHLKASVAWLSGDRAAADWPSSWNPQVVDDAGWQTVQKEFGGQYQATVAAIRGVKDWNRDMLGGAIGAIAHAAYHLGAIRQMIRQLQKN